jgi:hypothetical protein
MYRQLYQMGGIGTLPMDYGQSLQVPQQPQSMFTPTGSATSSPLLNYGQSQLGQAGGTPLTMRSGGMSRLGYQEGGMGMTQLGAPQEEPIFPRLETLNENLGQAEQRLGSPSNNQFNISPMTSAFTGRPQMNLGGRMGYQEGGMDQMMPQDQAMMQPQQQMNPPLEGIMGAMPQEAGGGQQTQLGEGDNALLTIIQLLIEQGLDPETAQRVARQILQAFAQGGEPAVEALANQFDQQMEQAPVMMATGGLTNLEQARQMLQNKAPSGEFLAYINSREADVLKRMGGAGRDINNTGVPSFIFKSIGKAIKSVFKSDIGKIALTVGATMLLGPAGAGVTGGMFGAAGLGASLTTNAFLAGAINAGAANLLVQGLTTGKFNPKQALLASVLGGATGYLNPASAGISGASGVPGAESLLKSGVATPPEVFTSPGTLSSGVTGATSSPTNYFSPMESQFAGQGQYSAPSFSPMESQFAGQGQYSAPATPPSMPQPNLIDKGIMSARQAGQYLSETGTNLMQDPISTLGRGLTNVKDFAGENKEATLAAATFGLNALAQQPGESDDEYSSRAARDPQVAAYITRYGGGIGLRSSPFYQMEKAVDPFAGTSLATSTNPFYPQGYSMGGRIGYAEGSTSFERQTLEKKGYGDMMKNMTPREISQLYDSVMGTFSRRFQAEGTMPMGEPRKNPAGIMELDYRAKGGFVPPVGIKEKADDIPAMLSNNEFVFTADAVRNAGGGNVNKGAQRMYGLMKQLEAGGRV